MYVDLEQFIFALSDTVDLVGVDELMHGKRVAYMAWKCAEAMGLDSGSCKRLFHLGLLHDSGVSSTEERKHLVQELEWDNSHIHCQIGADRMNSFSPLNEFALPILHHHTRWESLKDTDIPDKVKDEANLIYLLDRTDYLCQTVPGSKWLSQKDSIRHRITGYAGSYFKKELVEGFLDASANEAFWFSLEPVTLMDFIGKQRSDGKSVQLSVDGLKQMAVLFAEIVDAKSPYTAEHSSGVAALAKLLAGLAQLDDHTTRKIEVAALLHDLGKLQVPDNVLENPGPLVGEALSHMRHHSYTTYRILHNIKGFEEIADWAGDHHEALDGSGYPFRKTSAELGIESRIIAIADMFQALAQTRPYRRARPLESILDFLRLNSERGRIDREIVSMVMSNSELCYQHATVGCPDHSPFSRPRV